MSLKILKSTNYGILKVFLVILAVIIDIIFRLILNMILLIFEMIEQIIIFIASIIKCICKIIKWIMNLSDRKILVLVFRSTLILSITSVVLLNRYEHIIKNYDDGTSIFEFLASAIIFPLIMVWILDVKNSMHFDSKEQK